jgi:hypothetical protein
MGNEGGAPVTRSSCHGVVLKQSDKRRRTLAVPAAPGRMCAPPKCSQSSSGRPRNALKIKGARPGMTVVKIQTQNSATTNHTRLHLPAVPEAQLLQAGRLQPQAMRAGQSTRMGRGRTWCETRCETRDGLARSPRKAPWSPRLARLSLTTDGRGDGGSPAVETPWSPRLARLHVAP